MLQTTGLAVVATGPRCTAAQAMYHLTKGVPQPGGVQCHGHLDTESQLLIARGLQWHGEGRADEQRHLDFFFGAGIFFSTSDALLYVYIFLLQHYLSLPKFEAKAGQSHVVL